jgi:uncharacterized protein YndB with AHSA1/START domain
MSEFINRSPQEVFDFITDSDHAPKVGGSITSMVKLSEGPVGVGTRYRETRLMKGEEHEAELEVVEYDSNHRYAMKNETDGIETIYRYRFHPERGGTRVDLVCEVRGSGVKKLLIPVVVSVLKKEDGDHLERLKQAMEA